jgi:hypothetical protein
VPQTIKINEEKCLLNVNATRTLYTSTQSNQQSEKRMPTFDNSTPTNPTSPKGVVIQDNNVIMMKTRGEMPKDFITRVDINSMSDKELDEFLAAIRTRRMSSFIIFQQTQEDMSAVAEEKARVRLENEVTQVLKLLNTLDKQFDKLELRIHKIRGLRIQAGLTVI